MALSFPARVRSLYAHVPFCARKCHYCAFYSEPSDGATMDRYVSALISELEGMAAGLEPHTVFFGGGTPSLLTIPQWERLLKTMHRLGLGTPHEWTVECNPATVSRDKAKALRSGGVNRISMGVQSLNSDLLERLGRIHSREMAFRSFDQLREAGFDNINIDLMFGIPGQSMAQWQETLSETLALGSDHLSTYEVIYEEDTPLYAQLRAGKIHEDEDLQCAMYEELLARAAAAGLRQYEVANFGRDAEPASPAMKTEPIGRDFLPFLSELDLPARACLHNVNYWRGGAFRGAGPSATSYVGGRREKNLANTVQYCEQIESRGRAVESVEELQPLARAGETAAFGLRMVAGWPFEQFRAVTGYDLRDNWGKEMDELVERGWGIRTEQAFRLSGEGLRFADSAAQLFLCIEGEVV